MQTQEDVAMQEKRNGESREGVSEDWGNASLYCISFTSQTPDQFLVAPFLMAVIIYQCFIKITNDITLLRSTFFMFFIIDVLKTRTNCMCHDKASIISPV